MIVDRSDYALPSVYRLQLDRAFVKPYDFNLYLPVLAVHFGLSVERRWKLDCGYNEDAVPGR